MRQRRQTARASPIRSPQPAAVHQPDGRGPVRRQPGGHGFDLRVGGDDEVRGGDDAGELDARTRRFGELPVADGLGEDGADDQVSAADPAGGQPLAVHPGDQGLDVFAADGPDRLAADRGVDVGAQHRPVGRDAAIGAEVMAEPGLGLGAEQRLPGPWIDEHVRALVMLYLEREVLGLAQVITEGLLALAAGPAARRAVPDYPLVRAGLPLVFGAQASLEDLGHGHTPRDWSHSSTCRSRNRRYRPTR